MKGLLIVLEPTPCTLGDIIVGIISAIIIYFYVTTKNWLLNNVLGKYRAQELFIDGCLGLSFSIQGVALFTLGSYKIGCILLVRNPAFNVANTFVERLVLLRYLLGLWYGRNGNRRQIFRRPD